MLNSGIDPIIPLVDITSSDEDSNSEELCDFKIFPWLKKRKALKKVLSEKSVKSDKIVLESLEKIIKFEFHSEIFIKELKAKKVIKKRSISENLSREHSYERKTI